MCVEACASCYSLVGSSAGQGRDKTINVREQAKRSDCVRMIHNGNDMYRRHGSMARELQGPRKKYSVLAANRRGPIAVNGILAETSDFGEAEQETIPGGEGESEERQLLRLLAANVAAWRCHRCSRQCEQRGNVRPAGASNVE